MGKENEHEKALGEGVDDPGWGLGKLTEERTDFALKGGILH